MPTENLSPKGLNHGGVERQKRSKEFPRKVDEKLTSTTTERRAAEEELLNHYEQKINQPKRQTTVSMQQPVGNGTKKLPIDCSLSIFERRRGEEMMLTNEPPFPARHYSRTRKSSLSRALRKFGRFFLFV